jgi:hypothetical protein
MRSQKPGHEKSGQKSHFQIIYWSKSNKPAVEVRFLAGISILMIMAAPLREFSFLQIFYMLSDLTIIHFSQQVKPEI